MCLKKNCIILAVLFCSVQSGLCGSFGLHPPSAVKQGPTYLPPTLPPFNHKGAYLPPLTGSYLPPTTSTPVPVIGGEKYLPPLKTVTSTRSKYGFSFSTVSSTEKPKAAFQHNQNQNQQHVAAPFPSFSTFPNFNTFPAKPKQDLQVPLLDSPTKENEQKVFNSYDPQPSGIGAHLPTPSTPAPIALSPNTVHKQFKQFASSITVAPSIQPIISFDEPTQVLSPAENSTLYAAQLLASSLLKVSDKDSDFATAERHFKQVKSEALSENGLNRTDIVIVKSQKNAYLIPMKMSNVIAAELDPLAAQELYKKRNELQRAYTINQFLFIIKPEHINFLNKLV